MEANYIFFFKIIGQRKIASVETWPYEKNKEYQAEIKYLNIEGVHVST